MKNETGAGAYAPAQQFVAGVCYSPICASGTKVDREDQTPNYSHQHRAHELFAVTRWSDSLSASGTPKSYGGYQFGNRLIDYREKQVEAPSELTFHVIETIGGSKGRFGYDFLWRLRGLLDLLVGGVGMRRGRPLHRDLRRGDDLDFRRVEELERPHKLRLLAEMKVPGRAWLELEVEPHLKGSVIRQTALFYPSGLSGGFIGTPFTHCTPSCFSIWLNRSSGV